VFKELLVQQVQSQDFKVDKAFREQQEHQAHKGSLVFLAHKGSLEHKDPQDFKVDRVLKEFKVLRVLQIILDHKDLKAHLGFLVYKDLQVFRDLQELQVHKGHKEDPEKDMQVLLATLLLSFLEA
jgi:hypothetical protein